MCENIGMLWYEQVYGLIQFVVFGLFSCRGSHGVYTNQERSHFQ